MSLLYQATGFFNQGKLKGSMLYTPRVHFVNINITINGFEFIGINVKFAQLIKNSTGFRFDIPWSNIRSFNKSKAGLAHTIIIETLDNFYTILPVDPLPKSVLSGTKKNAVDLLATINKARAQVEKSKRIFCTNCGEKVKLYSDFCGNCGHKFS